MSDTSDLTGAIEAMLAELAERPERLLGGDRCTLKGILARLEWIRDRAVSTPGSLATSTAFNRADALRRVEFCLRVIDRARLRPWASRRHVLGLPNAQLARLCLDLERIVTLLGLEG